MCEQFNLVVLNGLLPGDEDGISASISHSGLSIADYFIMSSCLVHLGLQLSIVPKTDSKHMPVKMSLKLPSTISGTDAKPKTCRVQKSKQISSSSSSSSPRSVLITTDIFGVRRGV